MAENDSSMVSVPATGQEKYESDAGGVEGEEDKGDDGGDDDDDNNDDNNDNNDDEEDEDDDVVELGSQYQFKQGANTNAKETWTTLKTTFQGSTRVMAIKLQGLRRDFETLQINKDESMQNFLSRVQEVVNQIRAFGDTMEEKMVVAMVVRSLTPKFNHIVAAIEESKDLDTYTFDELMGSLQTHESRLSKVEDKGDAKMFYMQGETSGGRRRNNSSRGRDNPSRGRGRGRNNQAECYKKQREESQANYTEEKDEQPTLFMTSSTVGEFDASSIWLLDSGCSNHMTSNKQLFKDLDETCKLKVKLDDDKLIQVDGKGTIAVHTKENVGSSPESGKITVSRNILVDKNASWSWSMEGDNTPIAEVEEEEGSSE